MGYQALLFCPDEKTARTVTQVLSELEFNVESCTEPFAAVKKLMGQHFDAVVVDCDNEQNATLLFKSARNSTSNQASLAVAVVEGQAGVAKAFRMGANLVLTKPINIEQAKGTLRVARGLLRKGEPAKAAAPVTASPAIPATAKSVPAANPEAPAASEAISTASAWTRTDASPEWPAPAPAASFKAAGQDEDLLDISGEDSVPAPSDAPVKPAIKFITPSLQADKFLAGAVASPAADVKAPANPGLPATLGGGAASAPAPARERQDARVAETSPEPSAEADARSKKVEAVQSESSSFAGSAPTFTFGGANASAESSGGASKKIFLGIAAAAIIAVAAYAGWAHFQGHASAPENPQTETASEPVTPQAPKPSGSKPFAAATTPKPSTSLSSSQITAPSAKGHVPDEFDSALDDADSSAAPGSSTKNSDSSAMSKSGDDAEAAAAPLVVKGGKAAKVQPKQGVADATAPSLTEIATAGVSAPPPDLGSGGEIMPKPFPQTLNISQGVSRGLLMKKVQPIYPQSALAVRLEGSVELIATISRTGDITHVKVLSGDSQLSKAATDAVKQWKYKPYLLNGEPVEIETQITINFKLPK
jgi:TonB family protein